MNTTEEKTFHGLTAEEWREKIMKRKELSAEYIRDLIVRKLDWMVEKKDVYYKSLKSICSITDMLFRIGTYDASISSIESAEKGKLQDVIITAADTMTKEEKLRLGKKIHDSAFEEVNVTEETNPPHNANFGLLRPSGKEMPQVVSYDPRQL